MNINEAKYNQPRTPLRLKSNAAPRFFSLTMFYRGLKHDHVMDFSGLDRLLSLWIINELGVRRNDIRFFVDAAKEYLCYL